MMASVAFVLPLSAAAAFAFRGAASTSGRLLLALVAGGVFVGVLSVPWSMLIFGNVHTAAALMAVDAMSALAIAAIGLRGPRSAEPPPPVSDTAHLRACGERAGDAHRRGAEHPRPHAVHLGVNS